MPLARAVPGTALLFFLAAAFAPSGVRAEAPPVFLSSFGSCRSGPGQMQALWGIAAGPDGSVYVADEGSQRITRFDDAGACMSEWAVPNAFDVAVGPDGAVYVLRRTAARVDRYTAGGAFLGGFGSAGAGNGRISDPYGIAVAPNGEVFVADTGNDRIPAFRRGWDPSRQVGALGGQRGARSSGGGAADPAGNVFVINPGNGRVYRFSTAGALLGWWYLGGPNHVPITLNYGLALDGSGRVYVVESDRFVDVYTTGGAFPPASADTGAAGAVRVRAHDRRRSGGQRLRLGSDALPHPEVRGRAAGAGPRRHVGAGEGRLPLGGLRLRPATSCRLRPSPWLSPRPRLPRAASRGA